MYLIPSSKTNVYNEDNYIEKLHRFARKSTQSFVDDFSSFVKGTLKRGFR